MIVLLNVESPGNHPKLVMFKWAANGRWRFHQEFARPSQSRLVEWKACRMDGLFYCKICGAGKARSQVRERVFRQKAFGSFLALGQELAMLPRSAMILRSSRNKKTTDESRSEKYKFVQIPLCSAGQLFEVWSSFCRP